VPVPKVSQEHRDARREQLLAAAKQCFLRNGFQATSMQDLFVESGLSSGSFYRYFENKDDVIAAIAEENLLAVTALVRDLVLADPERAPGDALAAVLDTIARRNRENHLGAMAVLTWAEALRSPALRDRFTDLLGRMRRDLARLLATHQAEGRLSTDADPAALAKLFVAVVPGAILQLALFGERDLHGVAAAARVMWG
jgi:AcrR family transcriptional regulator